MRRPFFFHIPAAGVHPVAAAAHAAYSALSILRAACRHLALVFACVLIIGCGLARAAENPPRRIISLSPSITEILFALGAGGQVAAVTDFCLYPEATAQLPKIGGMLNPHTEAIIALHPDLIIHHRDSTLAANLAQNLGVPSLRVTFEDVKSIFVSIRRIGQATGREDAAAELIAKMEEELAFFRAKLEKLARKPTLLLLGDSDDPSRDLYGVANGAFLDELLTLAGGQNILTGAPSPYPKVSREYIIARSPDVIIVAGPKAGAAERDMKSKQQVWQKLASVKAVREHNVHFVGADYILIPGPRMTRIVGAFARALHPEIFSGDNAHGTR